MKKIILIAIIALSNNLLNAQGGECFTPDNPLNQKAISNYVDNQDGPIKIIRVNFHYMLKDDGTGNFNETSDNYSTRPYNGYMYAEDMVKWCNEHWDTNIALNHMPIPAVSVLPKKVRYQLCGVFFHKNTTDYYTYDTHLSMPPFVENSGEVLNIYIQYGHRTNPSAGGVAGGEKTSIFNAYLNYKLFIDNNQPWYHSYVYKIINHEVGHLLNLGHAIQSCCGSMTSNCDGLDDTPTYGWLINNGYTDPCCWNCPSGSNNLMDYCASQTALSPMQIARMHACIDGSKLFYRNCKYKTQSLNITNFTTNKAYITKYVTIPSNSNIVVGNNSALFINAEEVMIDGEFEVQLGSVLNVDIVPECN